MGFIDCLFMNWLLLLLSKKEETKLTQLNCYDCCLVDCDCDCDRNCEYTFVAYNYHLALACLTIELKLDRLPLSWLAASD